LNRRELIKNLALGAPALAILPVALSSCRKNQVLPENPYQGDVLIIGAGAAGLYAAYLLNKHGISCRILEASSRAGGRILPDYAFSDYPIELGASKLIGKRSLFYDLAQFHTPESILPYTGTNYFLLDGFLRTEYYLKENAGLSGAGATLFQMLESFASYPDAEQTLYQYLNNLPLENRFFQIANALIGNRLGADNQAIGMFALKEKASHSSSGKDEFFLKNRSIWNLFEKAFPDEIDKVQVNTPVQKIHYGANQVSIETSGGQTYQAGRVLLTVPLGVLKANQILFEPVLPTEKSNAIQKIGFGKGLRLVLRFSQPFWVGNTDMILGGGTFPEYEINSTYRSTSQHIVTATAMGTAAENLIPLSDTEIAAKAVQELSQIYPASAVQAKFTQQYFVKRWVDEPYIQGSYSYPSPGSEGQAQILAEPVAGKLFFAGEATNYNGHAGTVHGAMESAYRAVIEILNS